MKPLQLHLLRRTHTLAETILKQFKHGNCTGDELLFQEIPVSWETLRKKLLIMQFYYNNKVHVNIVISIYFDSVALSLALVWVF